MTTEKPKTSSMAAKLKGDGPITLTTDESNELRDSLRAVFKRDDVLQGQVAELQGLNTMMALGLYRKRLQVIHHEHDDGTVSFDLQPAPLDPLKVAPADPLKVAPANLN